jgi:hypothetical protein
MVLDCRHFWAVLFFVFLIPGNNYGQDAPPPKPKSSTADSDASLSKAPKSLKAPSGSILVRADVDSRIEVDDLDLGILKAGTAKSVHVILGEHLVHAVAVSGQEVWEAKVTLDKPQQVVVMTQLTAIINSENSAKRAEIERQEAAKAAQVQLQALMSSLTGRWKVSQSMSDTSHARSRALRADGTHNTVNASANIDSSYILDLEFRNGELEGSLTRTTMVTVTRPENACCTYTYWFLWNDGWLNQKFASEENYFAVKGAPYQEPTKVKLQARYERCSGLCAARDRDPRSSDFDGVVVLGSPTELEWTSQAFNPQTAVFKKAN